MNTNGEALWHKKTTCAPTEDRCRAHGREGGRARALKELSQALVAFPDSTIRPIEEPGLASNLTPQEIVHGKSQYESMLQGLHAGRGPEPQEQDRGLER